MNESSELASYEVFVQPYISCNYTIDYTVVIQNGKMVVKYIGAHTRKLRSVWVPKMAYSNLQGPEQVWVPKT